MKYVIGIIPGDALEQISRTLGEAGIYRLTISEVEVVDSDAATPPGDDERRLRLEIAVNDSFLQPALAAFESLRASWEEVWVNVLPLEDVLRIRTQERGPEAI